MNFEWSQKIGWMMNGSFKMVFHPPFSGAQKANGIGPAQGSAVRHDDSYQRVSGDAV